jgi:aspartyl-tRNA(Asn)/glutamyl-tRNA(Gln) amidotransferase subunit A
MNLSMLTIKEAQEKLSKREISSLELTQSCLEQIEEKDKEIGAFLDVYQEQALSQAKKIDKKIAGKEKLKPLAGIPLAIKDNILIEGERCTAASRVLKNYRASYDATVIRKLKEEEAVFLGKTNLDEFAMGSSTENSGFQTTRNPNDTTRVAGGSSGGSAAAVKVHQCLGALGSDTGGSIRQPAALCGVVGMKPSYGIVSRYGLIAFASSFDQIGPLAKTVDDAEIIFDAIKGKDEKDATSLKGNEKQKIKKPSEIRIGFPKEYFVEGIEEAVEKNIRNFIANIEGSFASIEEISLPHTKYALASYVLISASEASANLSRYDGIRYGISDPKNEALNLKDVYLKTRGECFGEEVKRRIMIGSYALSSGYYDAYYLKAQKVRALIREDFQKAFKKVDFILAPTSPFLAFKIGERANNALSMYLADIFTVPLNLANLPCLSMPSGSVNGLPVGIQVIGNRFQEKKMFRIASFLEKITANKL